MVERKYDQAVALVFEALKRAVLQFHDITRTWAFVSQADQIRTTRNQTLSGQSGMVVELGRYFFDPYADSLADMRGIVESA